MLAGMLTNLISGGADGFRASLGGIILPVLLLILLYGLRMLGAGDIKLFGAIGAIMGPGFVLRTVIYSFLAGGVIALTALIVRRNGRKRLAHIHRYMKSCFLAFSLLPYTEFSDKSDGGKFHFAYAVATGTVICVMIGVS